MTNNLSLAECPIGLFMCLGELCLKTEYGNNEGRIDAYIVSSGEFFWGDAPQTIASQRTQMVTPVELPDILALMEENARLREALAHIRDGGGMLNQPAALNCPELEWANKRIWHLETTARRALEETGRD